MVGKKDGTKGKVDAPQLPTATDLQQLCQPRAEPLPVSATCAGSYLAALSHTTTTAALYSTAAIAWTPSLPGPLVLPSHTTVVTAVASVLGLPRVGFVSVICPAF